MKYPNSPFSDVIPNDFQPLWKATMCSAPGDEQLHVPGKVNQGNAMHAKSIIFLLQLPIPNLNFELLQ